MIVFDALGTLLDQAPLRERLGAVAFDAWFERLLHSAVSLTLCGTFVPFRELAETTLRTTLAKLELEHDPEEVLAILSELPAVPDAVEAVGLAGPDAIVLTNGGVESTEKMLRRAGLELEVRSVEAARAYKPDARAYALVPERPVTLIAVHGWDVVGARAAGLEAVWVDREERRWPFPTPEPPRAPGLVAAVELARRHVRAR